MTEEYLAARRLAGTPEGVAYAKRLEVMSPADAAAEIAGMFCLCADEDLEYEIACDLQLNSQSAKRIAVEIRRDRERDWNDYLKQSNPADAAAKIVNTYTGIEDEDLTDKIASRLNCDRSRAEEIAVEIRRLLETEWRERRAYPRRLEGMSPADAAKEIDRYLVMWLTADENLAEVITSCLEVDPCTAERIAVEIKQQRERDHLEARAPLWTSRALLT